MARLIVLVALLLPGVALADPITLVASLAPIFGSTVAGFLVSYGGYIAFGALQLAGAASARRKQRAAAAKQRSGYLASLQDRNVTVLATESPWPIVYGSPAPIGGSIQAILTSGSSDQYQHLVIVYNKRESYAIDEIYIDGTPVGALDGSGWVTGGSFYESGADTTTTESVVFNGSGIGTVSRTVATLLSAIETDGTGESASYYIEHAATASGSTITAPSAASRTVQVTYQYATGTARVNIQKHLSPGGVDTADAFLIAAVPSQWTTAHKASNTTYLVVTLDLRFAAFQGGPPNITCKGRWSLVYDYRTSTTGYSANPALCAADFLRADYGFGATAAQIDTAAAIAAANNCDSQGFECHGRISTSDGRDSSLQQIEDSMAGASHFSGGVWRIMAGAWSSPVMSLTDADLAAPIEVVQACEPSARRYNGVRGQYAPAAGLGAVPDYTPYSVAAYLAVDPKAKVLDLPLPMVGTNAQCQKLAAIAVERSRLGETINYPARLNAWKLQPGDRVSVTNTELGYVAKTFRMVDWAFSLTAPVGLVLTEDTAAVYTGTFTNPDAIDSTSNLGDPFARPDAPANFTASSGTAVLQRAADGTINTRVLWTWTPPTSRLLLLGGYTQLQWRLATATDDIWQSRDLPADTASQYIDNTIDGSVLIGRVRFVSGQNRVGTWATISHTVVGKTEAPPDVDVFTIDGERLSWVYSSPPTDLAGFVIRFNYDSNTWWDGAAPLHAGVITDNPYAIQHRPAGIVTYLIKAVDTTGNYSANAAAIVANQGDPEIANLFLSWPQAPTFSDGTISGGTVSGGQLLASANDLFYGAATEPFYGQDADVFYDAATYADMSYTWAVNVTADGTLYLDHTVTAANYSIEYQRDNQASFYGADGDPFYDADADPFYGAPGAWTVWPGSLAIAVAETITFRISTVGGSTQGVVTVATPKLDVPDVIERVNDLVVSAGGTRLPITSTYRAIVNVQLTTQVDGNGGISARIEDKDETLGPLVKVFDAAGVAVIGLVDATIQGY